MKKFLNSRIFGFIVTTLLSLLLMWQEYNLDNLDVNTWCMCLLLSAFLGGFFEAIHRMAVQEPYRWKYIIYWVFGALAAGAVLLI